MRLFFKLVRAFLAPFILLFERLSAPRQISAPRSAPELALYQYLTCPFCVKVRRELTRLNLAIELRDAHNDPKWRAELEREGGMQQVPCLKIPDTKAKNGYRWMYESDDIIAYLRERYPAVA